MKSVPVSTQVPVVPPMTESDKNAQISPDPTKKASSLKEIQALLKFDGVKIDISDMHVTDYIGSSIAGHITPADGNVFADLGFGKEEAKALQEQTRKVIAKKLAK
jgi:hypothetical protein